MEEKGHFWYSRKQAEEKNSSRRNNMKPPIHCFCLIGGKEYEYTEWTKTKKPFGAHDDYIYLGEGVYSCTT